MVNNDLSRIDRRDRRACSNFDARARAQDPSGVSGQPRLHFRQNPLTGFNEDKACLIAPHAPVITNDGIDESRQLADQFHANKPAADDHESKQLLLSFGVCFDIRALEALDEMITQHKSVGQGLEGKGIGRAGDALAVGYGAEREYQLIVRKLVLRTIGRDGTDNAPLEVDVSNGRLDKPRAPQESADGDRTVPKIERAGARFKEKRRHQKEIVTAD